jgi:hypothetical protein
MPLSYTSEQVINNAASVLGKWVPGEALGAVEHDIVSDALDSALAELSKILVMDRDTVPAIAYEVVSLMTADFASAAFANVPLDYASVEPLERRLRYLVAQTPTYEPLVAYYF